MTKYLSQEFKGEFKELKSPEYSLDWCGSVGWMSSHKVKGHGLIPSQDTPGLWARSPVVGGRARGN